MRPTVKQYSYSVVHHFYSLIDRPKVAVVVATGGIVKREKIDKLTTRLEKKDEFSSFFKNGNMDYYRIDFIADCESLNKVGEDVREFLADIYQLYAEIILVGFSKAGIACYYALLAERPENVTFITGGVPWKGTQLCDSKEMKKISRRLPWPIIMLFVVLFLRTHLEKDLSPNSQSIQGINLMNVEDMVDFNYVLKPTFWPLKSIFPDGFVWWIFKGFFIDGVNPLGSQNIKGKSIEIDYPHGLGLVEIVNRIYEKYEKI